MTLLRQSPSRNQRTKGFKVKHVLQICLLLAIIIWLLYQVKHSHDNKKNYEPISTNLPNDLPTEHQVIKLGRKDLNPRHKDVASGNEREEEKEEETGEDLPETRESELEEGRGGGDDEIDGVDQERTEEDDTEEMEDLIDEDDKAGEEGSLERDSEEKEDQVDDTSALEEQAQSRSEQSSTEAREEQYKADDVAEAVVQNFHTVGNEIEVGGLRKVKEEVKDTEVVELEQNEEAAGINGVHQNSIGESFAKQGEQQDEGLTLFGSSTGMNNNLSNSVRNNEEEKLSRAMFPNSVGDQKANANGSLFLQREFDHHESRETSSKAEKLDLNLTHSSANSDKDSEGTRKRVFGGSGIAVTDEKIKYGVAMSTAYQRTADESYSKGGYHNFSTTNADETIEVMHNNHLQGTI